MAVAEPGDRVAAVEINELPAVGRLQQDAFPRDHLQGELGIDGEQRRGFGGHRVTGGVTGGYRGGRYSQAGVGTVSPAVSGKPRRRFIHWTPPLAAPFPRLSSAAKATTVSPSVLAPTTVTAEPTASLSRGAEAIPDQRGPGVEVAERRVEVPGGQRRPAPREDGGVDAPRERPGVGNEADARRALPRDRQQVLHFGSVPVLERLVGEQVRVAERMVRGLLRHAARSGAAGDRGDVEFGLHEPGAPERGGREGDRGGETPGMRDPPGSSAGVVPGELGEAAGERGEEVRLRMGGSVDLLVAGRIGVAEVGRQVHHRQIAAGRLGGGEERGHLRRRRLVGRGGERGEAGVLPGGALEGAGQVARRDEGRVRKAGRQVGEGVRDRESRVARRDGAGQPHAGMPGDPAEQLAGHVAGGAEHQRSRRGAVRCRAS